MMSNILIIAEHNGKELNSSTAKCVTCAKKIHPDSIDVVVLAADSHQIATEAAALEGVSKVIRVDHPVNEYPLAATLAPQIIELANNSYRLKKIRNKIHKNKFTKPLFNTKLYTKNIELAYAKIYENYLNKLSVENIEI